MTLDSFLRVVWIRRVLAKNAISCEGGECAENGNYRQTLKAAEPVLAVSRTNIYSTVLMFCLSFSTRQFPGSKLCAKKADVDL